MNLKVVASISVLNLVRDARRFILYNREVIENASLQTYASALVFSSALAFSLRLAGTKD